MKFAGVVALLLGAAPAGLAAQIAEGRSLTVQDVQCRGNHTISCEFIRSHLYLSSGMPLDETEISNAQLRLSSLRNFESVSIRLEKGSERDTAIVVIEVSEADPIVAESVLGISSRLHGVRTVFAGRLAHQNLFGAGKTADLAAIAVTPVGGDGVQEDYEVHLRYADPNLFGSDKYFAVARASWINTHYRDIHGNFSDFEGTELDLRVGRRFGDFSYFTFGVTFRPNADWIVGEWDSDGVFDVTVHDELSGFNIIYGWNSEDDLWFPTHGSSFHIGAGWDFGSGSPKNRSHVQFRKTWPLREGLFTVKVGGAPSPEYRNTFEESQLLALSYARSLPGSDSIKRGRWYIEPGFGVSGYTPEGEQVHEIGIKAGVRLDTTAFGIVDLYIMASEDPRQ